MAQYKNKETLKNIEKMLLDKNTPESVKKVLQRKKEILLNDKEVLK